MATAPTITQPFRTFDNAGIRSRRVFAIRGPVVYTAGGFTYTPQQAGLGRIEFFPNVVAVDGAGANPFFLVFNYNATTPRVQVFVGTTGLEVAGGTDLSAYVWIAEIIGY